MNMAVAVGVSALLVGGLFGGYLGYQLGKPADAAGAAAQADNAFKLGWVAAKCQDHANGTFSQLCRGVS